MILKLLQQQKWKERASLEQYLIVLKVKALQAVKLYAQQRRVFKIKSVKAYQHLFKKLKQKGLNSFKVVMCRQQIKNQIITSKLEKMTARCLRVWAK